MKSLRVLIADDNDLASFVLRRTLTKLGHTVVSEAVDGQQAVQIAHVKNPDLVILDIRMPVMDGFEAARRIHAERPVPTIILSCHTESGLGEQAAAAGANAYLVKPFTPEQLGLTIELASASFEKTRQLEGKLKLMNEALEARKVVERAKGILMRQTGLDEEAAYHKLQKKARNVNCKLVEVARAIIAAEQAHREGSHIAVFRSQAPGAVSHARFH
jgi:two-component system, response regulator PdtaR